jgi:hypothetical protein
MNKKNIKLFAIISLTLGLAPFFPEPHIVGKLKWLAGGGEGMQAMDYFDTLLHGAPWVALIGSIVATILPSKHKEEDNKI